MSKQLLRSGTSIGANVREAEQAESKADFIQKLSIALKEANETEYWLDLLQETKFLNNSEYIGIQIDIKELSIRLDDIGKSNWFMKNIGYSILRKN